ncbi:peptide ABC transporter permease [Gordonia sp. HNM0687]|uniref:Transport permease protein n=1 Tax=Gordonia mangrovi TaxID=2665643 RepID=A0A6L7GMU6_9ACTN|nr:ABC transporter permease [Gordonia mangrovi]MXP19848.1 peptide ABC transporter permease [Gordonia mangrovi]UVF79528.1 ABC transporter permease [Gordonia mangrovi]
MNHATPADIATSTTGPLPFPEGDMWAPEQSVLALMRGAGLQAQRILVKWSKDPATLLQSLLFPALMVLLFWLVLDRSVSDHSGTSYAFGMVPMVALIGAMSGASISGLGLRRERTSGLLTRMWTLPVHRAAAMTGRLAAEAVRVVVTVSFILLVGTTIGFRIETGVLGYLGILGVATAFGLSFSMMVTALALLSRDSHIVEWVAIGTNLAMFFNTGFVPADAYPGWLRPIVEYQPLSCGVEAIKAMATGGALLQPLMLTSAWSAAVLVVFTGPALIGYRRAALRG